MSYLSSQVEQLEEEVERLQEQACYKRMREYSSDNARLERELKEVKAICQDLHTSRAQLAIRFGRALNIIDEFCTNMRQCSDTTYLATMQKAFELMEKENEITKE